MEAHVTLPGRPITKKNSQQIVGNGRRIIQSKQYREYETACLWELKNYHGPQFDTPVNLKVEYWMPNRRSWPDLMGLLQATADILEAGKVISNDRLVVTLNGSRICGVDKHNPRADITITEVDYDHQNAS